MFNSWIKWVNTAANPQPSPHLNLKISDRDEFSTSICHWVADSMEAIHVQHHVTLHVMPLYKQFSLNLQTVIYNFVFSETIEASLNFHCTHQSLGYQNFYLIVGIMIIKGSLITVQRYHKSIDGIQHKFSNQNKAPIKTWKIGVKWILLYL